MDDHETRSVPMTSSLLTPARWATGVPLAVLAALALGSAGAAAAPLFPQCPPVGNNQGCSQLIVVNSKAPVVVQTDPAAPATGYDGSEDTLIGIQNNTGSPISTINLASTTVSIFGFDSDGLCNPSAWPSAPPTTPPGCPGTQGFGSTGYEGPNVAFTNVSTNNRTGTVNFPQSVPAHGSAYWGLEEALAPGQLQSGTGSAIPGAVTTTKSTASFSLTCVGSLPCNGSALLTVLEKISKGRVHGLSALKHHRKSRSHTTRVVIGSVPVSAAGGDTVTVTVALNAAGRRLASTVKSLPATVSVVLNQAAGGRQVTNVATVKFPGTKTRKHKHR